MDESHLDCPSLGKWNTHLVFINLVGKPNHRAGEASSALRQKFQFGKILTVPKIIISNKLKVFLFFYLFGTVKTVPNWKFGVVVGVQGHCKSAIY